MFIIETHLRPPSESTKRASVAGARVRGRCAFGRLVATLLEHCSSFEVMLFASSLLWRACCNCLTRSSSSYISLQGVIMEHLNPAGLSLQPCVASGSCRISYDAWHLSFATSVTRWKARIALCFLLNWDLGSEFPRTFTFRARHRLQARLAKAALGRASAVKLLLEEGLSLSAVALGVDIIVFLELPAALSASQGPRRLNEVQTAHLSTVRRVL